MNITKTAYEGSVASCKSSPSFKRHFFIGLFSLIGFMALAQPSINNALWLDSDGDGDIDQVQLGFSESVDISDADGAGGGLDVIVISGGVVIQNADYAASGVNSLTLNISSITGTSLPSNTVTYSQSGSSAITNGSMQEVTDGAGASSYFDGAAPVITDFRYEDFNGNGRIDRMVVTFSEALDANSNFSPSDLTFNPPGDFTGASFGGDPSNLINGGETNVTVDLDTESTVQDTNDSGSLLVDAQNSFNLEDSDANANNTLGPQSQASISDGARPVLINAAYLDVDADGQVDRVDATFSEDIGGSSYEAGDWTFSGILSAQAGGSVSGTNVQIPVIGPVNSTSLASFTLQYNDAGTLGSVTDGTNPSLSSSAVSVRDGAGPAVIAATTFDTEPNGQIDGITIMLSENITDGSSTFGAGTFDVLSGYTGENASSGTADDNQVIIRFAESGSPDTGLTPDVTLNAGMLSDGTNSLVINQTFTATTDRAVPVPINNITVDLNADGDTETLEIQFSEGILDTSVDAANFSMRPVGGSADTFTGFGTLVNPIFGSDLNVTDDAFIRLTIGVPTNVTGTGATQFSYTAGLTQVQDSDGNTLPNFGFVATNDGSQPVITNVSVPSSNAYADVTFSEGVYGDNVATNPLATSDFTLTITNGTATTPSVVAVTQNDNEDHTAATNLSGGETVIRVFFSYSGAADGNEILEVNAFDANSIFDGGGAPARVSQSPPAPAGNNRDNLTASSVPQIVRIEFSDNNANDQIDRVRIYFDVEVEAFEPGGGDGSDGLDCFVINYLGSPVAQVGADYDSPGNNYAPGVPITIDLSTEISATHAGDITVQYLPGANDEVRAFSGGAELSSQTLDITSTHLAVKIFDDLVPPLFVPSANFVDTDADGRSDRVIVSMSEPVDDVSITPADFLVGGVTPASFVVSDGQPNDAQFTLGLVLGGSESLTLSYTAGTLTDVDGAQAATNGAIPSINSVAPVIVAASTVDGDGDGHIDAFDLIFSENINDSSLDTDFTIDDDFSIGGGTYDIIGYTTGTVNDHLLTINVAELATFDTGVTPQITMIANEIDDGTTSLTVNQNFTPTDGASPVILNISIDDGTLPAMTNEDQINATERLTFSLTTSEMVSTQLDISSLVAARTADPMVFSACGSAGCTYSYTTVETGTSMTNGTGHSVQLSINDGSNPPVQQNLTIDVDNVVPSVAIIALETTNTNPTLTGSITDFVGAIIQVDVVGLAGSPFTATNNNDGTWSLPLLTVPPAIYDVDVSVMDPFGNTSTNIADTNDELQVGGINITVPTAVNLCIDCSVNILNDIVFQETKSNDFEAGTNRTFFIDLPVDFEFDTSLTPDLVTNSTLNNVNVVGTSYLGNQTLRITLSIDNTSLAIDRLNVSGLAIRAVGSPVTNALVTFTNGTASIFNLSDGTTVADLSSISAPVAPLVNFNSTATPTPPGVLEIEVMANSITNFLHASGVGSTFRWYDFAGNQIFSGQNPTLNQLDAGGPGGPDGFDLATAGLYSLFVSEVNALGCESSRTKINVFVRDRRLNPPGVFDFSLSDNVGSTIRMFNNPANFTVQFSGPGLASIDNTSNPATANFVPSTAGVGSHNVIYNITNGTTSESYNSTTTFTVSSIASIFMSATANAYCDTSADADNMIDVRVSDIPTGFHFYALRLIDNGTGTPVVGGIVPPAGWLDPTPGNPITTNLASAGWQLDPSVVGVGSYTVRRIIVPNGSIDPANDATGFGSATWTVNAVPTATISSPQQNVCESDNPFALSATVNSAPVTVLQYAITDLSNGLGTTIISSSIFDPSDPMGVGAGSGSYPVGNYQIDYTSNPLDDPNGGSCTDNAPSITVRVLAKPAVRNLDIGTTLTGRGQLSGSVYTFEYCEGDTFDNLQIAVGANQQVRWFTNSSLTNPLEIRNGNPNGSLVTATDLFGYAISQGGEDEDFYYVFADNTHLNGGCQSDPVQVRIIGRNTPAAPVVDLSSSSAGGQIGINQYEFNYCTSTSASIENITLNALPAGGEAYFVLMDPTNTVLRSGITSSSIDFTPFTPTLTPGDSYEFRIHQVNDDNSFPLSIPPEGTEFNGCAGAVTSIFINVFDIPTVPAVVDFSGNPDEPNGVITYYMCEGENLPDIRLSPPAGVNDYLYEWFEDVGETNPVTVADGQGDRIVVSDLIDEDFNFDPLNPGNYTMYVKLNSNVRQTASFTGCASGLKQVNIVVFPRPSKPIVFSPSQTSPGYDVNFDHTFNFCVDPASGLSPNSQFDAVVGYSGNHTNQVLWFRANADGSSLANSVAETDGTSVTASDLNISGEINNSRYFAVVHNADIVSNSFNGCFSDTTWVRINVSTVPAPQFRFDGIVVGEPTRFLFFDSNNSPLGAQGSLDLIIADASGTQIVSHTAGNLSPFIHTFSNPGQYTATMTITSAAGCTQSVIRRFQILEKIVVNGTYMESFESGSGGWVAEYQRQDALVGSFDNPFGTNSWQWGAKSGSSFPEINNFTSGAAGTTNAWHTNLSGTYRGGEESMVYSPGFDLSRISNPAIRFYIFRSLDSSKDGVVLQYSSDNGHVWKTIGRYDPSRLVPSTGQNWYNENGISSAPGDFTIGWGEGTDTNYNPSNTGWANQDAPDRQVWQESIHALQFDQTDNLSNIRFRFVLAASGAPLDIKEGAGFSFDEMAIYSLTKNVVVEQFSSVHLVASKNVNESIENEVPNVLTINYFSDLGNSQTDTDPINNRNRTDPNARSAYYAIEKIPNSVLAGDVYEQADEINWNASDIELKAIQPVNFSMPLGINGVQIGNNGVDDGRIMGSADFIFTGSTAVLNADLSFYFAIVEKNVLADDVMSRTGNTNLGAYARGDVLHNVLRVLLPNSAGYNYVGDVQPNQTFSYSINWDIHNVFTTDLQVIAFVQDNDSKQIIQAGWEDVSGKTLTNLPLSVSDLHSYIIYPVPADEYFQVELSDLPESISGQWAVFDQSGQLVLVGEMSKYDESLRIDTKEIPSGIYFFKLLMNDGKDAMRRVIIQR